MAKNIIIIVLIMVAVACAGVAYYKNAQAERSIELAFRYQALTLECEKKAMQAMKEAEMQRLIAIENEQQAHRFEAELKKKK